MENTLTCSKTFRYFTFGNPEKAKYILYVLHGYGQLAEFFIRKFHDLGDDYFVVAPEGMHRFYLKGSSGRVGASWMTKEAREQDISDTQNWLNSLKKEIDSKYSFQKEIVLGFSQGGATAARWNSINLIPNQIYWASVFPPDLDSKTIISIENRANKHFVLGTQDEYFNSEQQLTTLAFYSNLGCNTHTFNGSHTIDNITLKQILTELTKN
jgi:predicted esterase